MPGVMVIAGSMGSKTKYHSHGAYLLKERETVHKQMKKYTLSQAAASTKAELEQEVSSEQRPKSMRQ